MATYTTSTNTDPYKAIYGTKGSDVLGLQQQLNKLGAGLKEDSMYGPLTQAAYNKYKAQLGGTTPTPTQPTTTPRFEYTADPNDEAYRKALEDQKKLYEGQAYGTIDEEQIKRDTLAQFQAEIDATNKLYADKLARAQLEGKGRLGSSGAIQARRGLLGSDFGTAITEGVKGQNEDIYSSIENEKAMRVQEILGKARTLGSQAIAEKRAAKEAGLTEYLKTLSGASEMAKNRAGEIANIILAGQFGIDEYDPTSLEEAAKSAGVSLGQIKSAYGEKKKAQDLEKAEATKKSYLNVSEGQTVIDPVTGKVIYKAPKTYAPKSGGAGSSGGVGAPTETSYGGEFEATINQVANMESSVTGKKNVAQQLKNLIASGDYSSAYNQIANTVENGLVGEAKQRYTNARTDYEVMSGLTEAVKAFEQAGGDTGLLTGTAENILRKLGQVTNPKLATLATQLQREFQTYRNTMTGAAFSPGESREYAAVNPTATKNLDLNLAVLSGALSQLQNRVEGTINSRIPSAKYILEYAKGVPQEREQTYQLPDGTILKLQPDGTYE